MQKKTTKPKQKPKAERSRKWQPSAQQIAMAEMLVNPEDKRTKGEKMQSINLPERTFYNWMKNDDYIAYVNGLISRYTKAATPDVWKALIRKCTNMADVSAIKLFFEMQGMYSEKKSVELTGKDGGPIETKAAVTFYIPDNGRGDNNAGI